MRAVLYVSIRPETCRCIIVASVEQRIERLEHESLVLHWCGLAHRILLCGWVRACRDSVVPALRHDAFAVGGRRAFRNPAGYPKRSQPPGCSSIASTRSG